jgi:hypothetical protein
VVSSVSWGGGWVGCGLFDWIIMLSCRAMNRRGRNIDGERGNDSEGGMTVKRWLS